MRMDKMVNKIRSVKKVFNNTDLRRKPSLAS